MILLNTRVCMTMHNNIMMLGQKRMVHTNALYLIIRYRMPVSTECMIAEISLSIILNK